MAVRTNPGEVEGILGLNYDTINRPSLQPYIRTASLIIDRVVECATAKGYVHLAAELQLMETWIAAWCYTINDPLYKSKTTADSSASFADRSYLDPAKMLDKSGCLNSILTNNRAGVHWLGKTLSESIDYYDRN